MPRCLVPVFGSALDTVPAGGAPHEMTAGESDLIIVTQSCDLEQRRSRLVAAWLEERGIFRNLELAQIDSASRQRLLQGLVETLEV